MPSLISEPKKLTFRTTPGTKMERLELAERPYPRLLPEQHLQRKVTPAAIETMKAMIIELKGNEYGRQKEVACLIASRLGVSWRTVIFYGFRSEEYRKHKYKLEYLYKKRKPAEALLKEKEYSKRHHERKKALQGEAFYRYHTRFADQTMRRFQEKLRASTLAKAIELWKEVGGGSFKELYRRNPRFIRKVLAAEPSLIYFN